MSGTVILVPGFWRAGGCNSTRYTMDEVRFELVTEIRPAVLSLARRTPLIHSDWLSRCHGADVFLKYENLQVTGSFKIRGAVAAVAGLSRDQRSAGVVACSAGNHGQGIALAAQRFGIPCRVVVPKKVPRVKANAIRSFGAELSISPHDGYDATQEWMYENLDRWAATVISPFEHPRVIAGNGGTTALEIFEDGPELESVLVPCGGGGCAVGVGVVAKVMRPGLRVIGVNTDASPGMWMSRRDGKPWLEVDSEPTIADGIEGGIGPVTFELGRRFIDDVIVAKEASVRRAVAELARRERVVVEGAGAVGVAALSDPSLPPGPLCIILTGGNIDPELLTELLGE